MNNFAIGNFFFIYFLLVLMYQYKCLIYVTVKISYIFYKYYKQVIMYKYFKVFGYKCIVQ